MKKITALILVFLLLTGCTPSEVSESTDSRYPRSLEECLAFASDLGKRLGISVLIGQEAVSVQPWDYELIAQEEASLLGPELLQLEQWLSRCPAGMLRVLSEDCGGLQICLVREIRGREGNEGVEWAKGLRFRDPEGSTHLVLASDREHTLFHELFHVMEDFITPRSQALDQWDRLNPAGFSYDGNYEDYADRRESPWLEDDRRAFIDSYSMSFPQEDRARIMEYAMTSGNELLFKSPTMQKKLAVLSQGIREAFGLTDSGFRFVWEQYLIQ